MLNFLFLARGAARYEKDPTVALSYVDKAKEAAKAARADLASIASESGVGRINLRSPAPLCHPLTLSS